MTFSLEIKAVNPPPQKSNRWLKYFKKKELKDKLTLSLEFLVPLHFFGIAGNEEAQSPLVHLHVVPRVDQGAGRENDHLVSNNQRQSGVVFSRSASVCSGTLRQTESIGKAILKTKILLGTCSYLLSL